MGKGALIVISICLISICYGSVGGNCDQSLVGFVIQSFDVMPWPPERNVMLNMTAEGIATQSVDVVGFDLQYLRNGKLYQILPNEFPVKLTKGQGTYVEYPIFIPGNMLAGDYQAQVKFKDGKGYLNCWEFDFEL